MADTYVNNGGKSVINYDPGYTGDDAGKSSIDYQSNSAQLQTYKWIKKALVETRKKEYFSQLADVTTMPAHFGKELKQYHYFPVLDDRNVNDQGIDANGVQVKNGNLYGSSRDITTISGALPTLGENGGRYNRIGFSRGLITGTFAKYGTFYEWSRESREFDSDEQLAQHCVTELMNMAHQMNEAMIQIDLLKGAGTVMWGGAATQDSEVTGDGNTPSVLTYDMLMRLDEELTENKTPEETTIITGTRMIDTKTVDSTRVLYCGKELVRALRLLKDPFGNPAFVGREKYAAGKTLLNGEVGAVGAFRVVQVPEMLHWAGAGASATDTSKYLTTGGKFDVFPMLCVGKGAFTTIGFQTGAGAGGKWRIITKNPGKDTASRDDPYGETGFTSMMWYYGIMIPRPERIGLLKVVAPI